MKTWIKRTLISVVGASVVFGGTAACSHRMHHDHGFAAMSDEDAAKMKPRLVEKAGSKLDLDAAQKAKLGVLADTLRAQRNALAGTSTNPRAALQALNAGPTFDRAKAKSLVEEKTGAISTQSPQVIAAMADFYDSLRAGQQAQVREFLDSRRGRWGYRS